MYTKPESIQKKASRGRKNKKTKHGEKYPEHLFHVDSFCRADIDTGLAVHAHILVNFCLFVLHGDCRCRAFAHAGFTSGTFIGVNNCYQLVSSIVYVSQKTKNRFLYGPAGVFLDKWTICRIVLMKIRREPANKNPKKLKKISQKDPVKTHIVYRIIPLRRSRGYGRGGADDAYQYKNPEFL